MTKFEKTVTLKGSATKLRLMSAEQIGVSKNDYSRLINYGSKKMFADSRGMRDLRENTNFIMKIQINTTKTKITVSPFNMEVKI